jgi:hypothetical protein
MQPASWGSWGTEEELSVSCRGREELCERGRDGDASYSVVVMVMAVAVVVVVVVG